MDEAIMDWERENRTGLVEAVYAPGKPVHILVSILEKAHKERRRLLLTRLSAEVFATLPIELTRLLDYDGTSRTAVLGDMNLKHPACVVVVSAGMADLPVAHEVCRTLAFAGVGAQLISDVGVAGLWRLMDRLEEIRRYSVVIAIAGMEGALFSVLAGLVRAPIIAVPTSTGYGVGSGGQLALHSALGSCAPGLSVVNIDNGFGAAQVALRIVQNSPQVEIGAYLKSSALQK